MLDYIIYVELARIRLGKLAIGKLKGFDPVDVPAACISRHRPSLACCWQFSFLAHRACQYRLARRRAECADAGLV
jgi:hypothetical protein